MSSSSSVRMPKFQRGTEIAGWVVEREIGRGGFGTVHAVEKDGKKAAMKTEFVDEERSEALRNEVFQLRILQWSKHFCELFVACRGVIDETPFNMMVMTLVGRSLSTLRRLCPEARFTKETAFRLALQCIQALEDMHSVGVMHRDVKASNFAWHENRCVYLLDLGFCRRYVEPDGNGGLKHRKPRKICHFMGTSKYCSINAHNRQEQSRRDDLWCWLYMVIEFVVGRLIWSNDSDFRTALKKQKVGSALLNRCPVELFTIYDHIRMLKYESKPNYPLIRRKINEFLSVRGVSEEDPYDWEEGGVHYEAIKKKEEEKEREKANKEKESQKDTNTLLSSEVEISGDAVTSGDGESMEDVSKTPSSFNDMYSSFETDDSD